MKKGSSGMVSRIGRAAGARSKSRPKLGSGMAGRNRGYGPVTRTSGRVANAGRTGSASGMRSRPKAGSRYSTSTRRPVARGSLGKRYM